MIEVEKMMKIKKSLDYLYSSGGVPVVESSDLSGKQMFDLNIGDELINSVSAECNELINESGTCVDMDTRIWFSKNGYKIYAGEKDSFGWLTACIEKEGTNKVLVFG